MFFDHRQTYNAARLLLADEAGLGKTLSLSDECCAGMPAWRRPRTDSVPSNADTAVADRVMGQARGSFSSLDGRRKPGFDHTGHHIRTRGPEDVVRCPYQIGIVSTGLIFQHTEREHLLGRKFGTLVLDEAHRARRSHGPRPQCQQTEQLAGVHVPGRIEGTPCFARHTATPIQTEISELWDLLTVLSEGADYVLGRKSSHWRHVTALFDLLTGRVLIDDEDDGWTLLRNPASET